MVHRDHSDHLWTRTFTASDVHQSGRTQTGLRILQVELAGIEVADTHELHHTTVFGMLRIVQCIYQFDITKGTAAILRRTCSFPPQ